MVEREKPHQPIRRSHPFNSNGGVESNFRIDPLISRVDPQSPSGLLYKAPEIVKRRQAKKPIYGVEHEGRQAIVVRFPNLLHADERIKYNPSTGDVYIGSWTRRKSKNPKQKDEALRRWNKWGDIETAIRGATHIVEKHRDGGEISNALHAVHGLTQSLFDGFTSGEITLKNVSDYLDKAVTILEINHLIKPTTPNRQLLVDQIISALKKDSLGRFNPLVSRTRLASSAIKLLHELFIAGQTQQKYNLLLTSILQVERETERFFINQILDKSKELLATEYGDSATVQSKALWKLSVALLNPDFIKVAPYRKPAIMFVGYVFGFPEKYREKWEEMFIKIFGEDNLKVIKFIHENSNNGDIEYDEKFKERLTHGIQILDEALSLGERNLIK